MRPLAGLSTRLQHLLPQHLLSRLVRAATHARFPWLAPILIRWFVRRYRVDLAQAEQPDPGGYPSFNAFFTRALRPGARPVDARANALVSPADGAMSAFGVADSGTLVQAKGHTYSVAALLGGASALAQEFARARYATLYLSPRDYHRVHMPARGVLREARYVPGSLFTVNAVATRMIPGLFVRNERIVTVFDSEFGPLAVVMVGALFVGCMNVAWTREAPRRAGALLHGTVIELARGAELGRFNMGSTVIVLAANPRLNWRVDLAVHAPVTVGSALGYID
jgi:phosphatidylserine decarboxylase